MHLSPSALDDRGGRPFTSRERDHLGQCQECRNAVGFSKQLRERFEELSTTDIPSDMLDQIRGRIQAGEHVLLPVADPTRTPFPKVWASAAALLVAVGISYLALFNTSTASANETSGELKFKGEFAAGKTVEVEYIDRGLFTNEKSLNLRARFRTANDVAYNIHTYQTVIAKLSRNGNSLKGQFTVPTDVIFGAFAVENIPATRVDANNDKLWRVLSSTEGKPTFDALTQSFYDVIGESPDSALAIIRTRAAHYPRRVDGWPEVVGFEGFMLGQAHYDSVLPSHIEQLTQFHNRYKDSTVLAEVANGLMDYAVQLGGKGRHDVNQIARFWDARATSIDTVGTRFKERRLSKVVGIASKNPRAAMDSMDVAWSQGDSVIGYTGNGRNFALQAKDSAGIVRWTDRWANTYRWAGAYAYSELLDDSRLIAFGLDGLRKTIAQFNAHPDSLRPLNRTKAFYYRSDSTEVRKILGKLGIGLLRTGNKQGARDTLLLATSEGWDKNLFRSAADAMLSMGDTTEGMRLLALVSVDPTTTPPSRDTLSRFLVGAWGTHWTSAVESASREMHRRVMAEAVRRPVRGSPRVMTGNQRQVPVLNRSNDVTVVTFWSRYCAPSRMHLKRLNQLSADLSRRGIGFFAVTAEAPSAALTTFIQEQALTIPVFYDTKRETGRALGQWSTPIYYIIDRDGAVRFSHSNIENVLIEAVALDQSQ